MQYEIDNRPYLQRTQNGTVFAGSDVNIFSALALSTALLLYARHKILPNRATKPTAMLLMAAHFTGKTYKRGQYEQAAGDLGEYANNLKALPANIPDIQ